MLCAVNGNGPSTNETQAWETIIYEMANFNKIDAKSGIRKIQLYGKARAAPEDPLASELPESYLNERAESIRNKFDKNGIVIPIEVYK
jgi:hypothetical protein